MLRNWKVSMLAGAALLLPAVSSQAAVLFGPNGLGGFNAYERVDVQVNFASAIANSQVGFPGNGFMAPQPGVIGHIADFNGSADYEFLAVNMRAGAPQNVYIGLTDNPAFVPAAFEGGNSNLGALPANGAIGVLGERGAGFAHVAANALNTFHQRTAGVSIWGGGEPNGNTGENVAEIRGDGLLNDIGEGNTRPFIREWDFNLASIPNPVPLTPGFKVTDIRNVGAVTNANYQAIAANPPAGAIVFTTIDPVINYGGGGAFGGDLAFPQGGGDNFVTVHEGFITIPVAGDYTFQVNQDDTVRIEILMNGTPVVFEDTGCCNTSRATLNLLEGQFPIKVTFAEFGGGENVEVAAAFGAGVTDASQFHLLGDTANGGLAVVAAILPEPATAMLGMIGLSILGLRRRRAA